MRMNSVLSSNHNVLDEPVIVGSKGISSMSEFLPLLGEGWDRLGDDDCQFTVIDAESVMD